MFEFIIVGSSSAGNSYILRTENQILILECGVQFKKLLKALNYQLNNVCGCLVSHEHGDHSKSINEVLDAGIPVFSSLGTLTALGAQNHHRAHIMKNKHQINIGEFKVLPFDIQHDVNEPFGFLIYHKNFGKFLFATDTYYIKYRFKGLNYLAVEVNYSKAIINERERTGELHEVLKKRLLTSHMSLENFKDFLMANDLSGVKKIYMLHLSDNHSNESLFKREIQRLTGIPVEIARK